MMTTAVLKRNLETLYLGFKIYRTITVLVVLYGRKFWFLTWSEEQRLRVFANRVLKEIFGSTRDKVRREWRRIHKEELYDVYYSTSSALVIKSKRMRWVELVTGMGERRCV
jgi:hypothetical protein